MLSTHQLSNWKWSDGNRNWKIKGMKAIAAELCDSTNTRRRTCRWLNGMNEIECLKENDTSIQILRTWLGQTSWNLNNKHAMWKLIDEEDAENRICWLSDLRYKGVWDDNLMMVMKIDGHLQMMDSVLIRDNGNNRWKWLEKRWTSSICHLELTKWIICDNQTD